MPCWLLSRGEGALLKINFRNRVVISFPHGGATLTIFAFHYVRNIAAAGVAAAANFICSLEAIYPPIA